MTGLTVTDLCKHYGALKVTDHVSLDVAPGEIHAIIALVVALDDDAVLRRGVVHPLL